MLDPDMRAILEQIGFDPMSGLPQAPLADALALVRNGPDPEPAKLIWRWEAIEISASGGRIPARIYRPSPGIKPVALNFHGGGWVAGSVAKDDLRCQRLAMGSDCAVVSIDYRLAPEHPYPAGFEDCYDAMRWVAANADKLGVDASRMAVSGASAGANLAAACAIRARDEGFSALALQLLLYPVIDGDLAYENDVHRGEMAGGPYYLTRAAMNWFWRRYCPDSSTRTDRYASPAHCGDLAGLAKATVIVAELDPLAAEGRAYAERLRVAGVLADVFTIEGVVHGFAALGPDLSHTRRATDIMASALATLHARCSPEISATEPRA